MTPAARLQAAIEVVDRWAAGGTSLDRVLAEWSRASRFAGSGDRRAVGDLVYDTIRRMRSAAWVAGVPEPAGGRMLLLGNLILDGLGAADREVLFAGLRHGPAPLAEAERNGCGSPLDSAPAGVRLDLPDWLLPHLDGVAEPALAALRQRAPLFLRVNSLKSDLDAAITALAASGITAERGPLAPGCLRVTGGGTALAASHAYLGGLVEIQDAGSQAAASYAGVRTGETVLDYCAGGGGKSLAFAAAMGGAGRIYAHDISAGRLAQIKDRAARAGASVTLCPPGRTDELDGRCDLVFVDAPCSGSGAWRRNPHAKWRLTPAGLANLVSLQDSILASAARAVRPGGRLIYATCSLVPAENSERVDAFLAQRPDFRSGRAPLSLTPLDGGDGFFAAEVVRLT